MAVPFPFWAGFQNSWSKLSSSEMTPSGGGAALKAVAVAWAGSTKAAGPLFRQSERRVGDADAEVKRTGRAWEGEAGGAGAASEEPVG